MRLSTSAAFACAVIVAMPCLVWAHGEARDAMAVLREAKAAAGGRAVDRHDASYEEGRHGETTYRTWLDLKHYGMKSESTHGGKTSTFGFNGKVAWTQTPDGAVTVKADADSLREAITTAYASNSGYFQPDLFPASFRYVRVARAQGRGFDVIEITPKDGRATEYWFDRRTHLLGYIIDKDGRPAVAVEVSDNRDLDGERVGFHGKIRTLDGKLIEEMQVGSVVYKPLPSSTFDPPPAR